MMHLVREFDGPFLCNGGHDGVWTYREDVADCPACLRAALKASTPPPAAPGPGTGEAEAKLLECLPVLKASSGPWAGRAALTRGDDELPSAIEALAARAEKAEAERDEARERNPYFKRYVEASLRAEREESRASAAEASLSAINEIRDSIIGLQTVNWSEHVYPLVAALDAAGLKGLPYPEARAKFGTMLERTLAAEASLLALRDQYDAALTALQDIAGRCPVCIHRQPVGPPCPPLSPNAPYVLRHMTQGWREVQAIARAALGDDGTGTGGTKR